MKLNFSKPLSIGAFLIMSTAIVGCADDGTSVREFGTGALSTNNNGVSSGSSESEIPAAVEFDEASIIPDEYLAGSFAFNTGETSYIWMEAELVSGPDVEYHLLDAWEIDRWQSTSLDEYDGYAFSTASYPELSGRLTGSHTTDKAVVNSGAYMVLVENTAAGDVQPDDSGEESVVNFSLYIESMSSDGTTTIPTDVRVISISKVRVMGSTKK